MDNQDNQQLNEPGTNQESNNQNEPQSNQTPNNQNPYPYMYDPNMFQEKNSGIGIASLIIGIVSICCCCVWYIGAMLGIVGLALGIVALKDNPKQKGIAIAGIVTSSVGLFLTIIFVITMIVLSLVGDGASGSSNDLDAIRKGLDSIVKS